MQDLEDECIAYNTRNFVADGDASQMVDVLMEHFNAPDIGDPNEDPAQVLLTLWARARRTSSSASPTIT